MQLPLNKQADLLLKSFWTNQLRFLICQNISSSISHSLNSKETHLADRFYWMNWIPLYTKEKIYIIKKKMKFKISDIKCFYTPHNFTDFHSFMQTSLNLCSSIESQQFSTFVWNNALNSSLNATIISSIHKGCLKSYCSHSHILYW